MTSGGDRLQWAAECLSLSQSTTDHSWRSIARYYKTCRWWAGTRSSLIKPHQSTCFPEECFHFSRQKETRVRITALTPIDTSPKKIRKKGSLKNAVWYPFPSVFSSMTIMYFFSLVNECLAYRQEVRQKQRVGIPNVTRSSNPMGAAEEGATDTSLHIAFPPPECAPDGKLSLRVVSRHGERRSLLLSFFWGMLNFDFFFSHWCYSSCTPTRCLVGGTSWTPRLTPYARPAPSRKTNN